jgi:MerR family copper efflux transcriptional regulator
VERWNEGRILIGELARRAGVTREAIRYYERLGLLEKPRRLLNGYRTYTPGAADEIRWIRNAQALGFSLTEIRSLKPLFAGELGPHVSLPPRVRTAIEAKLDALDKAVQQMRSLQRRLRDVLSSCAAAEAGEIPAEHPCPPLHG